MQGFGLRGNGESNSKVHEASRETWVYTKSNGYVQGHGTGTTPKRWPCFKAPPSVAKT